MHIWSRCINDMGYDPYECDTDFAGGIPDEGYVCPIEIVFVIICRTVVSCRQGRNVLLFNKSIFVILRSELTVYILAKIVCFPQ